MRDIDGQALTRCYEYICWLCVCVCVCHACLLTCYFSFICFSCCILFSWSQRGGHSAPSLRFLFLYHLHDAAEARRTKRRSVLAPTLIRALRLTFYPLLWKLGQHHLVVFGSLNDHVADYGRDPLVVTEWASNTLNQVLLLRRHRLV